VEKMVDLKNRKYISLIFYYCPDKCVNLVLLLAYGRGRVFVRITVHYPAPRITSTIAIAIGPRPHTM